jgi:hypothetical protein
MDSKRFDALSRVLGTGRSRRGALGLLAGLAGLGAGAGLRPGQIQPVAAEAASCARICAENRAFCHDACAAFDRELSSVNCPPQASDVTGACELECGCAIAEKQEGSAQAGAEFCQNSRTFAQESCRAVGGF